MEWDVVVTPVRRAGNGFYRRLWPCWPRTKSATLVRSRVKADLGIPSPCPRPDAAHRTACGPPRHSPGARKIPTARNAQARL